MPREIPTASRLRSERGSLRRAGALALFALPLVLGAAARAQEAPPSATGGPGVATITAISGAADILRANGQVEAARMDSVLYPGDGIRTPANGKVELSLSDGGLLRLGENTEVRLAGPDKSGLSVVVGRIWAKVLQVFRRSKFEVTTPAAVAGVRGTTFRVTVDESGEAEFAVDEGELEVSHGDRRALLRAAMCLRATRGAWRPERFDPARRAPWEFWTDPIVAERLSALKAEAEREAAAADRTRKELDRLHQALAVDLLATIRVAQRTDELHRRTVALMGDIEKLRERKVALDREAPTLPGAVVAQRRADIRGQAVQLAATGAELSREYRALADVAQRGRAASAKHLQALAGPLADLQRNVARREELARLVAEAHKVRSIDPHWRSFRPTYDACEGAGKRWQQIHAACQRLTDGEGPGRKPPIPPGIHRRGEVLKEGLARSERIIGEDRGALNAAREKLAPEVPPEP